MLAFFFHLIPTNSEKMFEKSTFLIELFCSAVRFARTCMKEKWELHFYKDKRELYGFTLCSISHKSRIILYNQQKKKRIYIKRTQMIYFGECVVVILGIINKK